MCVCVHVHVAGPSLKPNLKCRHIPVHFAINTKKKVDKKNTVIVRREHEYRSGKAGGWSEPCGTPAGAG